MSDHSAFVAALFDEKSHVASAKQQAIFAAVYGNMNSYLAAASSWSLASQAAQLIHTLEIKNPSFWEEDSNKMLVPNVPTGAPLERAYYEGQRALEMAAAADALKKKKEAAQETATWVSQAPSGTVFIQNPNGDIVTKTPGPGMITPPTGGGPTTPLGPLGPLGGTIPTTPEEAPSPWPMIFGVLVVGGLGFVGWKLLAGRGFVL